jgi:hypothetical protein
LRLTGIISRLICVIYLTGISSTATLGSNDSISYSKHTIGVNFLRITDFDFHNGFIPRYTKGFNTLTGMYYQYKHTARRSLRLGVNYDKNSITLTQLPNYDGGNMTTVMNYRHINVDLGASYRINKNGIVGFIGIFEMYQRIGNGFKYQENYGYMTQSYNYHYDYRFYELGLNLGLGINVPISSKISLSIETNLQMGREVYSNRPVKQKDYTLTHGNPISRFSLNYRL